MSRGCLQKSRPGSGILAKAMIIETKALYLPVVHGPTQQAGGQGRREIHDLVKGYLLLLVQPGGQFLHGQRPASVQLRQESRSGQDPNLIHIAQQTGRSLERVQTDQPRAAAPPSQSAEDWLGLQQIAEAGQIDDQSMHLRQ